MGYPTPELSRTLTFILAGGEGLRLRPLTDERPKPLVPFGGIFRIIDFTLLNCLNSGLRRLYHIYHMDYRELVERHADSGAGLTIAAVEQPAEGASRFGVLEVEPDGRIAGFEEKPALPRARSGNPGKVLVSTGVYVFNTAVLLRAIEEGPLFLDRTYDFGKHVFPALINSVPVHAYPLRDRTSGAPRYWRDIGTIDSYYEASMDLTPIKPLFDPYTNEDWPTRIGKNPNPYRPSARIGGRVLNSVVSPGVYVSAGAAVERSVLMRGVTIGNGSRVRRAIVEEGVEIPAGVEIGYGPVDCDRYFVTPSGIVVVTRHAVETRPARVATVASA